MRWLLDHVHDEADHLFAKYGDDIFWIALIVLAMLLFSGYDRRGNEWRDEHRQIQQEDGYNL